MAVFISKNSLKVVPDEKWVKRREEDQRAKEQCRSACGKS